MCIYIYIYIYVYIHGRLLYRDFPVAAHCGLSLGASRSRGFPPVSGSGKGGTIAAEFSPKISPAKHFQGRMLCSGDFPFLKPFHP